MPPLKKEYIGDGVYVEFTGLDFIISVENGVTKLWQTFVDYANAKKLTDYINRALEAKDA